MEGGTIEFHGRSECPKVHTRNLIYLRNIPSTGEEKSPGYEMGGRKIQMAAEMRISENRDKPNIYESRWPQRVGAQWLARRHRVTYQELIYQADLYPPNNIRTH